MKSRLPRLQTLLQRLKDGQDVQRRDLEHVLTDSEWAEFNSWWADEKATRRMPPPRKLREYIELKQSVSLAEGSSDRYSKRPGLKRKELVGKRLANTADADRERAIEFLKEQLSVNPELIIWLVAQQPYGSVEEMIEMGELPFVVTSRTVPGGARGPLGRRSKRDLKIRALEAAIEAMSGDAKTVERQEMPSFNRGSKKRDFSGLKV